MKVLRKNGEMVEVSFEEQEGKKSFRHTSAHVLAQAVKRLYPDTKCAIGSAIAYMENAQEDYKLELIRELDASEKISFYKQGEYEEFCAGPHISNSCQIKAIKLLSVAGAYWRGDEKNQMLTRIYGISIETLWIR